MKNKLFLLLSIIALAGIVVALDYGNVQATATAISRTDGTRARCGCVCRCPVNQCHDEKDNSVPGGDASAHCACDLATPHVCSVHDHAWAWKANPDLGLPWTVMVVDTVHKSVFCYSWGKDEPKQLVDITDSLRVVVDYQEGMQQLSIKVRGKVSIAPVGYHHLFSRWVVDIHKRDGACIWYGDAVLRGGLDPVPANHLTISRRSGCPGWEKADFSVGITGDVLWDTIDKEYVVGYTGNLDDLEVVARKVDQDAYAFTPTMTQWGIIILVALIVASGTFILLRRRKAAVHA